MGRRKAKPGKTETSTSLDAENTTIRDSDRGAFLDDTDDTDETPSTMTRELEAVTTAQLIASMRTGSSPPQRNGSELDDLARTIEAPALPRLLIMDAADTLIARMGFANVTEGEIAKAANVGDDVFHAHFSDKTSVLRALNDRFCTHAIDATDDATRTGIWDNAEPRDVIEVAVRSINDAIVGRSGLVRAVLTSGDQAMIEDFRRVGTNITARITRVIEAMPGEDKPSERDIAFVLLLAVSLAHNLILVGPEWTGIDLDADSVHRRAVHAVRAYLDSRAGSS